MEMQEIENKISEIKNSINDLIAYQTQLKRE